MSVFITGTDTGVGKTYFSTLLIRALRAAGHDAVGFKPIVCGGWSDVDDLVNAADCCEPRDAVCPLYFEMPAAPFTAARADRLVIEVPRLLDAYRALAERHEIVVVEGVGGWKVPITSRATVADLATELALPVLVIVQNRLGAINHTLLTVESIARHGLFCPGLVLNHLVRADDPAMQTNRSTLESLAAPPVLCELQPGQSTLDLARFRFALSHREAQ